ncbi:MAG TPA: efflux RND transporter periplasmic adaptor subunit, partial [Rhodocyclaceae bacterium]|nr:efflux RND transporter periplasmic adaptor subunit [Rhodocyclaceae bacterium]
MSESDLSRLSIDRNAPRPSRRRARAWLIGGALVVVAALAAAIGHFNAPVSVETVSVGEAWPYQGVTVLNATGYVVAQRKASVAS